MSFGTDDLARLAAVEEVEIETQAPDGPVHRTIIWVVVDETDTFIRSYRGRPARWFREAGANSGVAIHVDGRRIAATAIPATDPDSIERISAALRAKYAHDPASLATMLEPEMLDANYRLEPA
ncbi:MAG: hypothetical protein QOI00_1803 [Chloroflexota bacterium]|jgi:hypothetical protein|nr:hypothetical protein [Chloroflexota bacterium]